MYLFYLPEAELGLYKLSEEESFHGTRVLRLKAGEQISLTNGEGCFFKAHVVQPDSKACMVDVFERIEKSDRTKEHLHIAVSPLKNPARLEWFLEKAVEIGIDEITLIVCEHTEKSREKTDRLQRLLISAMKQSLRSKLPKLNGLVKFNDFMKQTSDAAKLIAWCGEGEKTLLKDALKPNENSIILIGPEGDFSETEVKMAFEKGYKAISLGDSRLRTETAALVACHTVCLINQ